MGFPATRRPRSCQLEQGKRLIPQRFDLPEDLAPGETHCGAEGIRLSKPNKRCSRHARATPEIVDRLKGPIGPACDDCRGMSVGQPFYHAHAKAHRELSVVIGRFQRAIPARGVDADWPYFDPMGLGITHDLRWCVEAHRLGVQQRGAEHLRMPALHP